MHTPGRSIQVMGRPSNSQHQTALCVCLPSSYPGSFDLPRLPIADLGRWLLAMSCLGRCSVDPTPFIVCASSPHRGTAPHCVVWPLIWRLPSEFETGISLTTLVLSFVPERVGCLQFSYHCCLGLMDCPAFPLGSCHQGEWLLFLDLRCFALSHLYCLLGLVPAPKCLKPRAVGGGVQIRFPT